VHLLNLLTIQQVVRPRFRVLVGRPADLQHKRLQLSCEPLGGSGYEFVADHAEAVIHILDPWCERRYEQS
jgi:hypothetical protein